MQCPKELFCSISLRESQNDVLSEASLGDSDEIIDLAFCRYQCGSARQNGIAFTSTKRHTSSAPFPLRNRKASINIEKNALFLGDLNKQLLSSSHCRQPLRLRCSILYRRPLAVRWHTPPCHCSTCSLRDFLMFLWIWLSLEYWVATVESLWKERCSHSFVGTRTEHEECSK